MAIITLVPLAWLLAVTMTAGAQKVWHPDRRIGFLAMAESLDRESPGLEQALAAAKATGGPQAVELAEKALRTNRVLHFNNVLDAVTAGVFMILVGTVVVLSVREWILLLRRRKPPVLRETEPVWLPDYALAEGRPLRVASVLALGMALARELSGEAQMEREQHAAVLCERGHGGDTQAPAMKNRLRDREAAGQRFVAMTEQRFKGVRRCC